MDGGETAFVAVVFIACSMSRASPAPATFADDDAVGSHLKAALRTRFAHFHFLLHLRLLSRPAVRFHFRDMRLL